MQEDSLPSEPPGKPVRVINFTQLCSSRKLNIILLNKTYRAISGIILNNSKYQTKYCQEYRLCLIEADTYSLKFVKYNISLKTPPPSPGVLNGLRGGQGSFLVKAIARNQKPGLCLSSTTSQLCGPEQESCFQSQVRIKWDKVCESALHLVDAQKTVVPSRILKKAK